MAIIKSNYQPRPILSGYDLTEKEKGNFDYLSDEELLDSNFFRYKGEVYDIAEFTVCNSIPRFDAVFNTSYWSGLAIRIAEDGESVIVGYYYS